MLCCSWWRNRGHRSLKASLRWGSDCIYSSSIEESDANTPSTVLPLSSSPAPMGNKRTRRTLNTFVSLMLVALHLKWLQTVIIFFLAFIQQRGLLSRHAARLHAHKLNSLTGSCSVQHHSCIDLKSAVVTTYLTTFTCDTELNSYTSVTSLLERHLYFTWTQSILYWALCIDHYLAALDWLSVLGLFFKSTYNQ